MFPCKVFSLSPFPAKLFEPFLVFLMFSSSPRPGKDKYKCLLQGFPVVGDTELPPFQKPEESKCVLQFRNFKPDLGAFRPGSHFLSVHCCQGWQRWLSFVMHFGDLPVETALWLCVKAACFPRCAQLWLILLNLTHG